MREILRTKYLGNCIRDDDAKPVIYVIDKDLTPSYLPRRKCFELKLTTQKHADELAQTGVEYYDFMFRIERSRTVVYVGRTFRDNSAEYGNGSTDRYVCRRVSNKWKLRRKGASAYVAESH